MKGTIFADYYYPNEVFKRRNEYHRAKTHSNPTAGRDSVAVRLAHGARSPHRDRQAGVTPDHTQESQRIRCRQASDV